jgi:large repetitive protein
MTTKTWRGSGNTSHPKSGNWSTSNSWSPSGAPASGDDVIIGGNGTYTVTVNVAVTTVHSVTISDSGATLAIGASTFNVTGTSATAINVTAGHITIAGGTISDTAGGGLTLASGANLSGRGTVAASLSGSGTVQASGGTLDLTGAVSGTHLTIATASASDLKIDGTATTASAIAISSANQTLEIGAAGKLTIGTAENISAGKIQLDGGTLTDASGVTIGNGATLSGTGTVASALTLSSGTVTQTGGSLTLASITGAGTVNGTITNAVITAKSGTLDLTGSIAGTSTLAIDSSAAAKLKIDGTTLSGAISINSGNQTLEIGALGSLTLTAAESFTNGKIQLDGGTLTDLSGLTLNGGANLTGFGTIGAGTTIDGTGTIIASGGTLDIKGTVDSTNLTAFTIANVAGSDLKFESAVGTLSVHPTISFSGSTGVLDLTNQIANFKGTVAGFTAGDGIHVTSAATVSLDSTGKVLSVMDGGSNLLGTITLASSYAGDTFSVSNGTITVSVPSPTTETVSNVISGPSDSNNTALLGSPVIPPDNALAVSATDVLMAENDVIEITDRTGKVLMQPESLYSFFSASPFDILSDPRALVDPVSGKFIVTVDDLTTNFFFGNITGSSTLYAISNTTDPTGGWTVHDVSTNYVVNGTYTFADQPTTASNGTNLYIATALFDLNTSQYVTNAVTIVPLSGAAVTAYDLGSAADYRPVAVPGGAYFVGYTGNDSISIDYNSNGSTAFTTSTVSLGSIDVGTGTYTAAQLGSSLLLDAGQNAIANAVYANGYIYAVFEVVPPGASQPEVHWVKLSVSPNGADSLVAQGDIAGPAGTAAFNPSIAVDANGDVLVNYTVSGSTMDPAAYAAIMPAGSSSILPGVQYGASNAPETSSFGVDGNVVRWGDYSSAIADPAAANGFVVSNEIVPSAGDSSWATVTANISLSAGTSGTFMAVVASGSTTISPTSSNTANTSIIEPALLTTATSSELRYAETPSSTLAGLEALMLPAHAPVLGKDIDWHDNGGSGELESRLSLTHLEFMASSHSDCAHQIELAHLLNPQLHHM